MHFECILGVRTILKCEGFSPSGMGFALYPVFVCHWILWAFQHALVLRSVNSASYLPRAHSYCWIRERRCARHSRSSADSTHFI